MSIRSDDKVLIERASRFDQAALAEIYDTFSPKIYRYAVRLLGDACLAEDCVAETFSRFLKALQRHQGPREYLQAYLFRIAHNWVTDQYRRQVPPSLPLDPELRSDPEEDPHQAVAKAMDSQQVRDALALLTPDQRQVVMLKYLEDWPNEAIAQALHKPVGAVKALQHRALEALRRLLIQPEEMAS